MNKLISLLIVLLILSPNYFLAYAEDNKSNKNNLEQFIEKKIVSNNTKQLNMIEKKQPIVPNVSFGADEPPKEELIQVSVRNEFDEEIKVKFDTNREYPIAPHESISLGERKPGKYTLTIYNKKGEFVDNLTKNIDLKNKFILNKDTVSNSDKIAGGLTTGQKVAIGAGAVGAAALGGVLLHKALENEQTVQQPTQNQPLPIAPAQEQIQNQIVQALPSTPPVTEQQPTVTNNALVTNGKAIKFLNAKYLQVTVVVEGADGRPIGNSWVIPMAASEQQKPQALVYNGEKITVSNEQKIRATLPSGFELQRYAFELDVDSVDDSYIWVLK